MTAREKAIGFLETTRRAANIYADELDPDRTLRETDAVVMSLDRIATACSHALAVENASKRNAPRPTNVESPRCRNRKGQLSGARYIGRKDPEAICAFCKKPRKDHEFNESTEV